MIIPTFKYGLITHFKYPESRLFTYNLLGIRHHKIMKSEYQQVSKIESALMIEKVTLNYLLKVKYVLKPYLKVLWWHY